MTAAAIEIVKHTRTEYRENRAGTRITERLVTTWDIVIDGVLAAEYPTQREARAVVAAASKGGAQ